MLVFTLYFCTTALLSLPFSYTLRMTLQLFFLARIQKVLVGNLAGWLAGRHSLNKSSSFIHSQFANLVLLTSKHVKLSIASTYIFISLYFTKC